VQNVSLRLGPKLNLSLLLFMLILGTATAALVLFGFHRSQNNAAEKSREGLEAQGLLTLRQLAETQAYLGALQMQPAAELALHAAAFMISDTVPAPAVIPNLTTDASGRQYNADPTRATDLLVLPGSSNAAAVERDLRESGKLDQFFPTSLRQDGAAPPLIDQDFQPIAAYFLGVSGVARYFPPTGNLQSSTSPLTHAQLQEFLDQFLDESGPAGDPASRLVWTPPYEDEAGTGLVMTAYAPVYDGMEFRGVMGVDLSIARLATQVDDVRPTESGFAFYVDRDGILLAAATSSPLIEAAADPGNLPVAAAFDAMERNEAGIVRATVGGREVFLAFAPFPEVGGSFGLVTPVDELTMAARDVTDAINDEGNRTLGFILVTMVFLFVLALAATAWFNRKVLMQPIDALVTGTRAVAAGNFDAVIPVHSNDELGDLAESFNRMTAEVRTRSEALQREILERERTAVALAEREESARQVYNSVSDAIFITDMENRIIDANPAAIELHGYSLEELRALEPFALVHERSRGGGAATQEYLDRIAAGELFRTRAIQQRKDGSTFMAEVLGREVAYLGGRRILSVIRDISEEVERQQLLEQRVDERTKELSLLLEVSKSVASTLDLDVLFSLTLDQIAEVVPFTGGSVLVLEGETLVTQYARTDLAIDAPSASDLQRFPVEGLRYSLSELLRGQPVVVANIRGETAFARDFRWMAGERLETTFAGTVSWMALPMVHKGRFIGLLAVSSDKEGAFNDRYASLGLAVANQAAIAIENARLFAETERRASEMTALSRIATSLDLEQSLEGTLNSVAQRVVESTNAVASSLSTIDDEGNLAIGGSHGLPDGALDAVDEAIRLGGARPNQRALASQTPVIIRGVRAEAAASPQYKRFSDLIRDEEWDTLVIVPMRYGDRDLGTLETYYRAEETPDEREIALIGAMARQAATAIENAVLFAQTEKRVRQLEALTLIASSFSLELSMSELIDRMSEQIVRATTARAAGVTILEEPGGTLRMVGASGVPDGFAEAMEASFRNGGGSTARRAMLEQRTIYQENLRTERLADPRYSPAQGYLSLANWDSTLLTPIAYGNRSLGVLMLGYPLGADPDAEERAFVEAIADQTALVIENARLFQQASSAAALEERQKLARELHDSVSQALYGIALGARTARRRLGDDAPANIAEPLDYVLSLAEAGLTEMRALIFELRPESIATEGLVAAIGRQVAATQARYGIQVNADLCAEPEIALDVKEALYRIAQESMHNTVKHARAKTINMKMVREPNSLRLEIDDDGQGFDPDGEFPGHLGLRSMKERARGVGATLDIESKPGRGTTVKVIAPG